MLRPLPSRPIDMAAQQRRALSLRGKCRRHGTEFPFNLLRRGAVIAAGCPVCYPQFAR